MTDVSEPFLCIVAPIGSKRAGDCPQVYFHRLRAGRAQPCGSVLLGWAGLGAGLGWTGEQACNKDRIQRQLHDLPTQYIYPLRGCQAIEKSENKFRKFRKSKICSGEFRGCLEHISGHEKCSLPLRLRRCQALRVCKLVWLTTSRDVASDKQKDRASNNHN